MDFLNITLYTSTSAVVHSASLGYSNQSNGFSSDVLGSSQVTIAGYLFLAVELFLMVVILLGNGLTLAAIYTTPSLQSLTYR